MKIICIFYRFTSTITAKFQPVVECSSYFICGKIVTGKLLHQNSYLKVKRNEQVVLGQTCGKPISSNLSFKFGKIEKLNLYHWTPPRLSFIYWTYWTSLNVQCLMGSFIKSLSISLTIQYFRLFLCALSFFFKSNWEHIYELDIHRFCHLLRIDLCFGKRNTSFFLL